jgi:hypothetical protein
MHENREEAQQQLSFPPALIFVGLGARTFFFACWEDFSAILRWKNKSSWNNLCLAVPLRDVHEIAGDANLHPGTVRFFSRQWEQAEVPQMKRNKQATHDYLW